VPHRASPSPASGTGRLPYLVLGYASLGLAGLGAVLPLLPTTVFLILAAWAFGKASPSLRARLLADPRVGPALTNWQRHGIVSRRAKRAACLAMAVSWLGTVLILRDMTVSVLAGLCMAAVACWLVTRPEAPPPVERAARS
jgi:hypothetical protein